MVKAAPLFFAFAIATWGQSLHVYSELARLNSDGEVIAPEEPREILSPAIVRNGFTSFQIVVQVPQGISYWLYVGQNPVDATRIAVYRQTERGLEPIELPYGAASTQILWMDLWADREAPVRRIKIEPQLNVRDDWIAYPMEVRVMDAIVPNPTVPDGKWPEGSASPAEVIKSFLCGKKLNASPVDRIGADRLRFRNAQQDLALAGRAPQEDLRRLAGACDAAIPPDPEWYLRIRDYLFRRR